MDERFKSLEKLLFTTSSPEATAHDSVFVIDNHHVVTYTDSDHSELDVGQQITIHNVVDKNLKVEVTAIFKEVCTGIIIFKTLNDYSFEIEPVDLTWYNYVPRPYHILGVNQSDRSPVWQNGTLLKHSNCHIYYLGSTDGMLGDVIFDEYAKFVGLVVTKRNNQVVILPSELILTHVQTVDNENYEYC